MAVTPLAVIYSVATADAAAIIIDVIVPVGCDVV
jgi:hypothetical protein